MQIDWFTVIAQLLNFLVLVWLLKRFLFKPIQHAIDERERKISSQLRDAEDKVRDAIIEQEEFRKKNELFDQEKKGLMDKVIAETNEEREILLDKIRTEATDLQSNLEKALNEIQENLNSEIEQKIQLEVFHIAGKALGDLASQSLEKESVNIFLKRVDNLQKEEKVKFIEAFTPGIGETNLIKVQSAFDLPKDKQTEIKKRVNEVLGINAKYQFKISPGLICGIELTSNGYKLGWSFSEYLNSLKKSISEE